MSILEFLTKPETMNAMQGIGSALSSMDRGQAPNLTPYYDRMYQLQRQQKMRDLSQKLMGDGGLGLSAQQRVMLGPIMEAMPEQGMGILMNQAFPRPSDPYARYKNVGGALWDLGGQDGPTQLSKPEVGGSRYYTVNTSRGVMLVDKHTGQSQPLGSIGASVGPGQAAGDPYLPPSADPTLQGEITAAKEGAKAELERAEVAPQKIANAETSIALIDQALQHPGFDDNYGLMGMVPDRPGSNSANANALLEQLRGKAFLQAFETLKGGGQITEREGIAAQNAYARLQSSQSPAAARQALTEMRTAIAEGVRKLKAAGGPPQAQNAPQAQSAPQGSLKPLSEMSLEELQELRRQRVAQ